MIPDLKNPSEEKFERDIVSYLVEQNGYEKGTGEDYSAEYALDETRLLRFLRDTQPDEMEKLGRDPLEMRRFLARVRDEITERGVIDVLRKGVKHAPAEFVLCYMTPSEGNARARELYEKNIFSVTRQLYYSPDASKKALDLCVFLNGVPVLTIELKNRLTGQTTANGVKQYRETRDPKELLFMFKRCAAHFALDEDTVEFCTKLEGNDSRFLPFNKGNNGGKGNPIDKNGRKTAYFWEDILSKNKLSRILENYAQVIVKKDNGVKTETQIWPRYHQLDCVEALLSDVKENGIGKRYLIQHSAGSGKSNTIAWLAHQLIGLQKDGRPMFDSCLVVTDRNILDRQIGETVKQFMQVKNTVKRAESARDLGKAIEDGKRIIITTVEKFPFIVSELGQGQKSKKFAIIIDEAHSGESGRNFAQMNIQLGCDIPDGSTTEEMIAYLAKSRKLLPNASYFAFTATPTAKTLETFGVFSGIVDGKEKYGPFHLYSMKQAIEEGFILDVLQNYTSIDSYFRIMKTVEDDPMFEKKGAKKQLRAFVESDPDVIAQKAAMMTDHFLENVIAKKQLNGQARAMVVTASIARCVEYYCAITKCLRERHNGYQPIVAFSGTFDGKTAQDMNGFTDKEIPEKFRKDPYRILVVADMFQTGFDEPLLQTMYVDKPLSGIAAVQTLSRLNRACPGKKDVYVLDFANQTSTIEEAFKDYYEKTILSGRTDPNQLHDLVRKMEGYEVYTDDDVERIAELFLSGDEEDKLYPILDKCVEAWGQLEEDEGLQFRRAAGAFVKTYSYLGSILPYENHEWEKLSIFLNLLIQKLPARSSEDLSEDILEAIDLSSYHLEARETTSIKLEDKDAEIAPLSAGGKADSIPDAELDYLSKILDEFNEKFGNQFKDPADIRKRITVDIPQKVTTEKRYLNAMRHDDKTQAREVHDEVLAKALRSFMLNGSSIQIDDTSFIELYKKFKGDPSFRQWLQDTDFALTYNTEGRPFTGTAPRENA